MILKNFVVFEGIDGSGTSTQLDRISELFLRKNPNKLENLYFTFEPTDGVIGKLLRKALSREIIFSQNTIAHLFAADRSEHVYGEKGIINRISSGQAVFSDRYVFSSLAYQGESSNYDLTYQLNANFPLPEYLFYFDIDPEISMSRVESRTCTKEIYELKEFQTLVRNNYMHILSEYKKIEKNMKVFYINAIEPISEITDYIWSIVKNLPK